MPHAANGPAAKSSMHQKAQVILHAQSQCHSQKALGPHITPTDWTLWWPCTPCLLHTENRMGYRIWLEFSSSETWSGLCLTSWLFKKSTIYLACRPDGILFPTESPYGERQWWVSLGCFHGGCQWRPMAFMPTQSQNCSVMWRPSWDYFNTDLKILLPNIP